MTDTSTSATTGVSEAATRLESATATSTPCSPVRDLLGATDVNLAYQVQRELTDHRILGGARVVGRKIGLTSEAVQNQLGVDSPDFGVLFDDMRRTSDEAIDTDTLLQPKIEAEIAFVLAEDLDGEDFSPERIRAAIEYATAALEIVDSRVEGWDIRIVDTIADNGSSALFVLGDEHLDLDDFDPIAATMTMRVNGDIVSQGTGTACHGDPLVAVAWLARTAAAQGQPLLAGQIILSGALGPMAPVAAGDHVTADIAPFGSMTVSFGKGSAA
ncbi:2-keto-4-pentenoate hydratase [Rhodococcus baikonurensis]|uniref:2-keto-4-pentenoate hydratase n=1 Tax=Rhodococcus baikonurensis TaxID=172041 RepID=UPI0037B0D8B4